MKNYLLFLNMKDLFTEVVALCFTAAVFIDLYYGETEKSLIFVLLLIALQIEKVSDRMKK